ncbi:MAG: DUF4307 domain-containing protein [Actinomycetes bacterium]
MISPSAPGLTDEQRDLLLQRYGPARRTPVAVLLAVGLLVVAFLAWVGWAALQQSSAQIAWQTFGYHDVSDTSVTVEFDVTKPAGQTVTCTVQALDVTSAVVGQARVEVSGDKTDVRVTYALPVTGRPTSAQVLNCTQASNEGVLKP